MYYPLLRGRQFELIALRELCQEDNLSEFILPIIEPVKSSFKSLALANQVFVTSKKSCYLIMNPIVGERKGDTTYYPEFLKNLKNSSFLPAFYYRSNSDYIMEVIDQYELSDSLLIGTNEIQPDDDDFRKLLNSGLINKFIIEDPDRNRELKRLLQNNTHKLIRLDDLFEPEPRNSNFLEIESHRFSEEHIYFDKDGYEGFSDYTILPSHFAEGGSSPRAVVIHLTYLNDNDQVWIRHFTSNTNDSIANVQGKFGEACAKAVSFIDDIGLNNSATSELSDYFDQSHYPGLGTVKKISIKNHLIVVGSYLNNK